MGQEGVQDESCTITDEILSLLSPPVPHPTIFLPHCSPYRPQICPYYQLTNGGRDSADWCCVCGASQGFVLRAAACKTLAKPAVQAICGKWWDLPTEGSGRIGPLFLFCSSFVQFFHSTTGNNLNWLLNILFVALFLSLSQRKKTCQFRYLLKLVISSRTLLY